jgi:hypothetical protein
MLVSLPATESRGAYYLGLVIVFLFTVLIALVMLGLTMLTFDRCMGRASARPRLAPRPPRRISSLPMPHAHPEFHAKTQRKSETQRIPIQIANES